MVCLQLLSAEWLKQGHMQSMQSLPRCFSGSNKLCDAPLQLLCLGLLWCSAFQPGLWQHPLQLAEPPM